MASNTEEAYLHLLTGGFDNHKRRKVRKLFTAVTREQQELSRDLDLVVGVLEELHAVGVKEFTADQAAQVLEIFEVGVLDASELEAALQDPRLGVGRNGDKYMAPAVGGIKRLRERFCNCEPEALHSRLEQIRQLATIKSGLQAGVQAAGV